MPFLQLTLNIGTADPTPLEDALFSLGATSITLQDSADDPILEPAPGATPLWPTVTMKALFASGTDADGILESLKAQLGSLTDPLFENIEDKVWEREWLKDFKPMRFGERLWICPGGMLPVFESTPPSSRALQPCLIHLDPGLAFGTGTHPTTALCLEWLDGAQLRKKEIIDYGCGSGILAIAALKLGATSAVGIDIDSQALIATRSNAERNGVSDRLKVSDVTVEPSPADVVLANILAGPLDELAPKLGELVLPGGYLVLSGLLENQAPDLARRYAAWFDMEEPVFREDWARLVGRRRERTSFRR